MPAKIGRAVTRASRIVPGARTCLVQAIAVQVMLAQKGYPANLCLGAKKDGKSDLKAHAWIESNGSVVVGGKGLENYSQFRAHEKARRRE